MILSWHVLFPLRPSHVMTHLLFVKVSDLISFSGSARNDGIAKLK